VGGGFSLQTSMLPTNMILTAIEFWSTTMSNEDKSIDQEKEDVVKELKGVLKQMDALEVRYKRLKGNGIDIHIAALEKR